MLAVYAVPSLASHASTFELVFTMEQATVWLVWRLVTLKLDAATMTMVPSSTCLQRPLHLMNLMMRSQNIMLVLTYFFCCYDYFHSWSL